MLLRVLKRLIFLVVSKNWTNVESLLECVCILNHLPAALQARISVRTSSPMKRLRSSFHAPNRGNEIQQTLKYKIRNMMRLQTN